MRYMEEIIVQVYTVGQDVVGSEVEEDMMTMTTRRSMNLVQVVGGPRWVQDVGQVSVRRHQH